MHRLTIALLLIIAGGVIVIGEENIAKPIETKHTFTVWHSNYEDKQTLVIIDTKQWNDLRQKANLDDIAGIDFEKDTVLIVSAGRKPTTGYEVKIQKVIRQDKKVLVKYTVAEPIPDEPVKPVSTTPLAGVVIEKQSDQIEFTTMEEEIETLVKDLGADDWEKRNESTAVLIELGKAVVPYLIRAFRDNDPEVRMRSRVILESIVPYILAGQQGGWIGINMNEVPTSDPRLSEHIKEGVGVEVMTIIPGQPSEKFGLKEGDIIITFENDKISSLNNWTECIRNSAPGTRIKLGLIRDGQKKDLELVLGRRPKEYQTNDQAKTEELWQEWITKYLAPK